MKPTIIIDGNNLTWMSYHSLPKLSTDSRRTEIAFGFLLHILSLAEKLKSDKFIFCFDSHKKYCKRREIYPEYKGNRENNKDIALERREVAKQMRTLQEDILPSLGFQNIFQLNGYEADDLIAYLVTPHSKGGKYSQRVVGGRVIIVSADDDLNQLIQYDVSIYKPRKRKVIKKEDYHKMQEEQGLRRMGPQFYAAEVKAIAGCTSDNVTGVEGIGEKRAWQYLQDDKFKEKIESKENQKIIKRNRELVHLPFGVRFDKGWPRYYRQMKIKREVLFREDFIKTFNRYWFRYFLKKSNMERWKKHFNLR